MNKKFALFLLLLLAGFAVFMLLNQKPKTTLLAEDMQFAVADTAAITKIFIADKGDNEILLERSSKNLWRINKNHAARKDMMDILLLTIKRIKVDYPVADAAYNNVIRNLASDGKKVEIYTDDPNVPVKTYFLGATSINQKGNYALIEGAKRPFVVNVPNFVGYISGRYVMDEEVWRDRWIYTLPVNKIKNVSVVYGFEPNESFHLKNSGENDFALFKINKNGTLSNNPTNLKPALALNYLQGFRGLGVETFANDFTRKDSLFSQTPFAVMEVENTNGEKKKVEIFYMPVNKRSKKQFERDGSRVKYDVDRYFAALNERQDVGVIQEYVFGKVFTRYSEFLKMNK